MKKVKREKKYLMPSEENIKCISLDSNRLPSGRRSVKVQNCFTKKKIPFVFSKTKKGQQKPVPIPESSERWGFPVYFSPRADTEKLQEYEARIEDRKRLKLQKQERIREARQKELLEKKYAHEDYETYLYYACKYGPLESMIYVCSNRPGQVYHIIVNRASKALQGWLKERIIAFRKHVIKELAKESCHNSVIKGMERIHMKHEQEHRVQCSLRRLLLQTLVMSFNKWVDVVQKSVRSKAFLKKILKADMQRKFTFWKTTVDTIKTIREGKINSASIRLFRRNLYLCFEKWKTYASRSIRIKESAARKVGHQKQDLFLRWKGWVPWHKLATKASIIIQRFTRGWLVRKSHRNYMQAATKIQAIFRGFSSRRRTKLLKDKLKVADEKIRRNRVEATAGKHAAIVQKIEQDHTFEAERSAKEQMYIDAEIAVNKQKVQDGISKLLPNKYKSEFQIILKGLKRQAQAAGTYMNTADAAQQAQVNLLAAQKSETTAIALQKFRESNPPKYYCTACSCPFARQVYLEAHDCNHSVEKQRELREEICRAEHLQRLEEASHALNDSVPYCELERIL